MEREAELRERASDEALAARAARGDREAFGRLFERYSRPVYSLAVRMTLSPDRARDLAQDVFARALGRIRTFDPSRRFSSWIFRVAANWIRNDLESRGRWRSEDLRDDPEDLAPRPDMIAAADEELGRVREAAARVPEPLRLVLLLYFQEQMAYEQIAETLDITVNLARVRLFRALRRLQEELAS